MRKISVIFFGICSCILGLFFLWMQNDERGVVKNHLQRMKIQLQYHLGQEIFHGVYYNGNRLMLLQEEPQQSVIDAQVAWIQQLKEREIPVYVTLMPTATGIYENGEFPERNTVSQRKMIQDFYESLPQGVSKINVYGCMDDQKEANIFYCDSSALTSYGAYLVYCEIIKKMGYSPVAFRSFQIQHLYSETAGALAEQSGLLFLNQEAIDIWKNQKRETETIQTRVLEDYKKNNWIQKEYLNSEHPLDVFGGTATGVFTLYTEESSDSSLLIYGSDSSRVLCTFLSEHFRNICFVNLDEYSVSESEPYTKGKYDQILFLSDTLFFNRFQS